MNATESKIVAGPAIPSIIYFNSALILFSPNFLFHQNVLRRSGICTHFTAFLVMNNERLHIFLDRRGVKIAGYQEVKRRRFQQYLINGELHRHLRVAQLSKFTKSEAKN